MQGVGRFKASALTLGKRDAPPEPYARRCLNSARLGYPRAMQRLSPSLPLALAGVLAASLGHAAPGDPIQTNDYRVEFFQGPVLAPLRVTGLAGAYAGYAEGVDGIPSNAAAPAVREPFSVHSVDWDIAFSLSFPATFRNSDLDNDGSTGFVYEDFIFYTLGGMIQIGPFGAGVLTDTQSYDITPSASDPDGPRSTLNLRRIDATGGWALLDHQIVVGGGVRAVWLDIATSTPGVGSDTLVSMVGAAPQVGALIRPNYRPWRLGVTYRAAVSGASEVDTSLVDAQGVHRAAGLAVPASIHLPWEIRAGFAIQLGPRPLNPSWINPAEQEGLARMRVAAARDARQRARSFELSAIHDPKARARRAALLDREEASLRRQEDRHASGLEARMLNERRARYWNWPREHILVVAEALVTGPSPSAVSLESFLSQREQRAGYRATVTPKLGVEGEPVVDHIKTRFGTYLEPARYRGHTSRQHFTFGFDVRVFDFGGWSFLAPAKYRITAVADLAPRYESFGVSFGAWH